MICYISNGGKEKSKQKRCSNTRTLMGSLIYTQEVLGIDHSKVLFNKGNIKMM